MEHFTGTPTERWLAQWGARTLLISGYHTDWCVEMAERSARAAWAICRW